MGENSIVVVPGANHHLTKGDIEAAEGLLKKAAVVVLQLEIPLETVVYAIQRCQALGVPTILDPAPVPPTGLLPDMFGVTILSPNQGETDQILADAGQLSPEEGHQLLLKRGVEILVLKQGAEGASLIQANEPVVSVPGFSAQVVDTTAAGDAFTGALAVAFAEGHDLAEGIRFANAAGALCCETLGAQPAMPSRAAVLERVG